jgi:hypothetical protein
MSVAVTVAKSCPELTNVVGRLLPFHRTTESVTNPLPFRVSAKAGPPATTEVGDI